jgi:hypothetical protein
MYKKYFVYIIVYALYLYYIIFFCQNNRQIVRPKLF